MERPYMYNSQSLDNIKAALYHRWEGKGMIETAENRTIPEVGNHLSMEGFLTDLSFAILRSDRFGTKCLQWVK